MAQHSEHSWEIVTRRQAKAAGELSYFTGQPCVNGHLERRAVSNCVCYGCVKDAHARSKAEDPDRYRRMKAEAYLRQRPQRAEFGKRYAERNRETIAARMRRWGAANRDRIAKRKSEYEARTRPERSRVAKAYREANREKIRAYYEANKFRYLHRNRLRQMLELRATPEWADLDAIRALYKLAAELSKSSGVKQHVDHMVPLKGRGVCGLHVEYNLQVVPWLDNLKKGNRQEGSE